MARSRGGNVRLENGKIALISSEITPTPRDKIVDATGLTLLPGVIIIKEEKFTLHTYPSGGAPSLADYKFRGFAPLLTIYYLLLILHHPA